MVHGVGLQSTKMRYVSWESPLSHSCLNVWRCLACLALGVGAGIVTELLLLAFAWLPGIGLGARCEPECLEVALFSAAESGVRLALARLINASCAGAVVCGWTASGVWCLMQVLLLGGVWRWPLWLRCVKVDRTFVI